MEVDPLCDLLSEYGWKVTERYNSDIDRKKSPECTCWRKQYSPFVIKVYPRPGVMIILTDRGPDLPEIPCKDLKISRASGEQIRTLLTAC